MPSPTRDEIEKLGGCEDSAISISPGEDAILEADRIDFTDDGIEKIAIKIPHSIKSLENDPSLFAAINKIECRYLWVMTERKLWIMPEATRAKSGRGHACHTNIIGNARAARGGEMWFLASGEVVFNCKSGRFSRRKDECGGSANPGDERAGVVAKYLKRVCGTPIYYHDPFNENAIRKMA